MEKNWVQPDEGGKAEEQKEHLWMKKKMREGAHQSVI